MEKPADGPTYRRERQSTRPLCVFSRADAIGWMAIFFVLSITLIIELLRYNTVCSLTEIYPFKPNVITDEWTVLMSFDFPGNYKDAQEVKAFKKLSTSQVALVLEEFTYDKEYDCRVAGWLWPQLSMVAGTEKFDRRVDVANHDAVFGTVIGVAGFSGLVFFILICDMMIEGRMSTYKPDKDDVELQ